MPPNMQEELEQPLEKFGTDITALAREHKLDANPQPAHQKQPGADR